ncbi:MAG TPA: MgtC/SapB family protein [Candidatus Sulfotelmatobacter sp.]|jgi:putative Mg2+ transporter-C (MgtC) family protein|nr:MgtC/SapB family protein [Candidatus Sulfotelmatobacter sp.]
MPLTLTWHDIALRLALSVVAGGLLGLDRGEHGRPAGLRTTLLVCLAAAVAMIQANLLLVTNGKAPDSFVVLDLMRLPLGILTGMGFIGGGAILRRDNMVLGVTTAATLWFVTVIGLCFGGGQIALGVAGLGLGVLVLSGLRWFDHHMSQEQHGILSLTTKDEQPTEDEIRAEARAAGYKIRVLSVAFFEGRSERAIEFNLEWRAELQKVEVPDFVRKLSGDPRVAGVRWRLE